MGTYVGGYGSWPDAPPKLEVEAVTMREPTAKESHGRLA